MGRGGATGTAGSSGTSGTAGATGTGGQSPSSGCNTTGWPTASPTMLDVTDKAGNTVSRQFYFALPSGYDNTKPLPLIFGFHYLGGMASTIAGTGSALLGGNYYGLKPLIPNAIYVAPQGLSSGGNTGFPNTNDQDIAFTKAMVSYFETNFCVDKSRIFSTGFSYGGMMSHTIACEMPDVFRAVGIMSGILIVSQSSCINHGIAAWITHGEMDTTLPYANGVTAKDRIVSLNHCGSTTHPVDPSPCVQYDGCDAAYPTIWCSRPNDMHAIPSFGASAIANFFMQF